MTYNITHYTMITLKHDIRIWWVSATCLARHEGVTSTQQNVLQRLAFIPMSLFSVSVSANTWATAIPTSCACHELWGNIQGEGLELRSLKRGPVWWRLRRWSAVQYALKWKEWPKAPWRGRLQGRAERGLHCLQQAALNTEALNLITCL